jgi:hypothetical protein
MTTTDYPDSEEKLVSMLLSRNGRKTCITTVEGEPMRVIEVKVTDLPSAYEWDHYADMGGIGLSADDEKYSFYSTEIDTIEDIISGTTSTPASPHNSASEHLRQLGNSGKKLTANGRFPVLSC